MATLKQMVCNFSSENTNTVETSLLLSVKELCSVREIGRKISKVFSNATQQTVSHWIWTISQARPGLKYNQFNSATNNGHKQWPQTMVQTRQKTTIKWTRNSLKKISATGDISVPTLRNQRIKFVFGKLGATIFVTLDSRQNCWKKNTKTKIYKYFHYPIILLIHENWICNKVKLSNYLFMRWSQK